MRSKGSPRRIARKTSLELLEQRQMFSAEPLGGVLGGDVELHSAPAVVQSEQTADFWYDGNFDRDLNQLSGDVEQTLASAHVLTGLMQARQTYGFTGIGQTVAVIDSGIAYDHPALGGGFGANYRVVGGWDFTEENDANPYDDGPSGSHGTHVSGIIGATMNSQGDSGVAPDVDLVGLRVFNDQGAGYFSWVENALRWVHTNRNAFENPITAVNLSLGTSWNATTVPSWSTLEDEFAQLKADGIFIAVSAGNSFTTYNATGLSYPAASPNVVPVMSVDDNGALSYFSQRQSRAIAAPGRTIHSTVPDYVGNQNGVTDDWANYSGTSMSSPYVAGASVVIREAMQLVGYTNITEDTIYNQMVATADRFYDSATSQWYNRLNVESAIAALMPADDYGSTSGTAYNLGSVSSQATVSGLIGTLSDKDYFTFTAGTAGTISLDVSATNNLVPNITLAGGGLSSTNGTLSFDVVAGQSYTFSVETVAGRGLGHYNADLTLANSFEQPFMAVKTDSNSSGTVFSLDSDGWLSVDGVRIWNNTRDFALGPDGTLYWHCTNGVLLHRKADTTWDTLGYNVTKFVVTNSGTVYSLDNSHWLSINGTRAWSMTADFGLAADGTLFWQCTNGVLQERFPGGAWASIASGVNRFTLRDDGVLYLVDDTGWLKINGTKVWDTTHDFMLMDDHSVFWHCTNGVLLKNTAGAWQTVGFDVTHFAVRNDGVVFTLTGSGDVFEDGVLQWSNISDMRFDSQGHLEVVTTGGTAHALAGQFRLSRELVAGGAGAGVQTNGAGGEAVGSQMMGLVAAQMFGSSGNNVYAPFGLANGVDLASAPASRALPHDPVDSPRFFVPAADAVVYDWERFRLDDSPADDAAHELASTLSSETEDSGFATIQVAVDTLFEELGA